MRRFLLLLLITWPMLAHAGWTNLNTGINDDLTGVVFWGNVGFVSGHKGIYYTTTGGNGPASWTRYNIVGNTADSLVYNYTRFTHAYSNPASTPSQVYFCGTDTVNGTAIILQINYPALSYSIRYQGPAGSALNRIGYCSINSNYYAVGDNGLIVRFNTSTYSVVSAPFTHPLSAIHFAGNSYFLGTNGYHIYGTTAGTTFTYNVQAAPGKNFRDVVVSSGSNGYRVGNGYYRSQGANITESTDYDFGPLNARCILERNSMHFVGTDHGIFRSTGSYNFLEWQPSSGQYSINALWNLQSATNTFYACGDNGVVLYTTDQGGPVKPYVYISTGNTACLNTSKLLAAFTGSSSSCQRFIDGVLQPGTSCASFSYTFTTSGPHTLQWVGSNGSGNYDTAFQTITVYDYPQGTRPYTISDTLLCHETPITITIDSSELNTFYLLRKVGQVPSSGSSGNGTGGQISFMTNPLSPGQYYLQASSLAGGCAVNFTDTFTIQVEYTTARFHTSLINAEPGETVHFYQNCRDAQFYQWNFGPTATLPSSPLADPDNTYLSPGNPDVQLICWSAHGCYDSTISAGPTVFLPAMPDDSCWTLINSGTDHPSFPLLDNVTQMSPSKTGFFTTGIFYPPTRFSSRRGDTLDVLSNYGGYMAKYDSAGVLKWWVQTKNIPYSSNYTPDVIRQVVEAPNGDVYICGTTNGWLYDNTGDSAGIGNGYYAWGYIAKLDSLGKLLWRIHTQAFYPTRLMLDRNGNLLVGSEARPYTPVYFNGTQTYTLTNSYVPNCNYYLLKINPSGAITWHTGIYINAVNGQEITDIGTDYTNNIYVTGVYEYEAHFYSAGSLVADTLPGGPIPRVFLAKFNPSGTRIWNMRTTTPARPMDMVTDSAGYCYIAGTGHSSSVAGVMTFENANGSLYNFTTSPYFIARISPNGICQWIQGSFHSYYGYGHQVTLHNGEIRVLGSIRALSTPTVTSTFTSANTITKTLTIGNDDYFIAAYDDSGNLLRIVTSGMNSDWINPLWPQFTGFFTAPGGAYYICRNMKFFVGYPGGYSDFGNSIPVLQGTEGYISHVYEDCGTTYVPCRVSLADSLEGCDMVYLPTGQGVSSTGIYYDTVTVTSPACDTLYNYYVTVYHSDAITLNETACDSFTLNGTTYTAAGTYQQLFTNIHGCDSVVQLTLTLNAPDVTISLSNYQLQATATAGAYQWVDCANGYALLPGETGNLFSPATDGVYAVIVNNQGCVDTSQCLSVILPPPGAVTPPYANGDMEIYPNPTQGAAMVYTTMKMDRVQIAIRDRYGRTVYTQSELNGNYFPLDLSALAAGVYLVELSSETGRYQVRLIKE